MTPDQATNVTRNFIEWVFGFQLAPAIVQSLYDGAVTEISVKNTYSLHLKCREKQGS